MNDSNQIFNLVDISTGEIVYQSTDKKEVFDVAFAMKRYLSTLGNLDEVNLWVL